MKKQTLAAVLLIAAITIYRLCIGLHAHSPWLENFAPVAAIALCGGIFLPRPLAFAIPIASLCISDVILDLHYGVSYFSPDMLVRYITFAAIVAIGLTIRRTPRFLIIFPAAICASILFYIVTNTSAWLTLPDYSRTFSGWLQALTIGLPGYPPTWTFFRSSIISDLLFTALFVFCIHTSAEPSPEESSEEAEPAEANFRPAFQKR